MGLPELLSSEHGTVTYGPWTRTSVSSTLVLSWCIVHWCRHHCCFISGTFIHWFLGFSGKWVNKAGHTLHHAWLIVTVTHNKLVTPAPWNRIIGKSPEVILDQSPESLGSSWGAAGRRGSQTFQIFPLNCLHFKKVCFIVKSSFLNINLSSVKLRLKFHRTTIT